MMLTAPFGASVHITQQPEACLMCFYQSQPEAAHWLTDTKQIFRLFTGCGNVAELFSAIILQVCAFIELGLQLWM